MEITTRSLLTLIHGMGFGALYLMACSGALVELHRRYWSPMKAIEVEDERFLGRYLVAMAVVAWVTVLTGAYIIYPWYRAVPPREPRALPPFRSGCSCRVLPPSPGTPSAWSGRSTSPGLCPSPSRWPRRSLSATGATWRFSPSFAWPSSVLCWPSLYRRGHRRLFWRHARQERAGRGRLNDSHRRRRTPMSVTSSSPAPQPAISPIGGGAGAVLAAALVRFVSPFSPSWPTIPAMKS